MEVLSKVDKTLQGFEITLKQLREEIATAMSSPTTDTQIVAASTQVTDSQIVVAAPQVQVLVKALTLDFGSKKRWDLDELESLDEAIGSFGLPMRSVKAGDVYDKLVKVHSRVTRDMVNNALRSLKRAEGKLIESASLEQKKKAEKEKNEKRSPAEEKNEEEPEEKNEEGLQPEEEQEAA